MHHATTATIDLAAIRHNLKLVKKLAPNSQVMAVIKADAYGHGLLEIANSLAEADGLAVARIEEALQLREAGIKQKVLLLGSYHDSQIFTLCSKHNIDIVIHNLEGARLLAGTSLDTAVTPWLKFNSGMHRLGLTHDKFLEAHRILVSNQTISEPIFMTHFSSPENSDLSYTEQQRDMFLAGTEPLRGATSLANSAAIIQHPSTHGDWVRPGIMLYGSNPVKHQQELMLQPAMTVKSKVVAIRTIAEGEGVGYNSTWRSEQPSRIATIGIGYGDGYPRHASNGTPVLVNGKRAGLVGTVSMDLITIDITGCGEVNIGDEVILWGNALKADEVAAHANTISYQLFTSLSKRVPRHYINQ